jgi:hypothetical protein
MRILIIEPECNGHNLVSYIKFILRLALSKKIEVILLTSSKSKDHLSLKILKKINPEIKLEFFPYSSPRKYNSFNLLLHQIKLYFTIKKAFSKIYFNYKINKVFIHSLDHFDKALAIFGDPFKGVPFFGMYVNPKFHLSFFKLGYAGRFRFISSYLFKRLLNIDNFFKILVNDHFFLKYLKKFCFRNIKKVQFFYHPVEFFKNYLKKFSYKKLALPKDSIPILVYGYLRRSKGIIELLQAISDKRTCQKVIVLLAGDQDPEIRKILRQKFYHYLVKKKKLFIFNSFQDIRRESILFSAAKIIWVGYRNVPFASGILHQAAFKRIPVIATCQGIIGDLTLKYNLGLRVDVANKVSIIKSINKICFKNFKNKSLKSERFIKNSHPKIFMNSIHSLIIKQRNLIN